MWPLIGAAIGGINSEGKKKDAEAQRIIELAKARWGALSNGAMGQAQFVAMPNMLADMASGAVGGMNIGNGISQMGQATPGTMAKADATIQASQNMQGLQKPSLYQPANSQWLKVNAFQPAYGG